MWATTAYTTEPYAKYKNVEQEIGFSECNSQKAKPGLSSKETTKSKMVPGHFLLELHIGYSTLIILIQLIHKCLLGISLYINLNFKLNCPYYLLPP